MTFTYLTIIVGIASLAFLHDDKRLYCVEDTPQRRFWTYWGSPPLKIPQGTLCFGDIELLEGRTLL